MTASNLSDGPTDREDFKAHLHHLLAAARDNDVEFEGSYAVRSLDPDERDYQVEISEVVSRS